LKLSEAAKPKIDLTQEGAQLAKDLNIPQAELTIRKGFHNEVDKSAKWGRAIALSAG